MQYTVDFTIHGMMDVNVEADSVDEAIEKAEAIFEKADLNFMEIGESDAYSVTDDDGSVTYL